MSLDLSKAEVKSEVKTVKSSNGTDKKVLSIDIVDNKMFENYAAAKGVDAKTLKSVSDVTSEFYLDANKVVHSRVKEELQSHADKPDVVKCTLQYGTQQDTFTGTGTRTVLVNKAPVGSEEKNMVECSSYTVEIRKKEVRLAKNLVRQCSEELTEQFHKDGK